MGKSGIKYHITMCSLTKNVVYYNYKYIECISIKLFNFSLGFNTRKLGLGDEPVNSCYKLLQFIQKKA